MLDKPFCVFSGQSVVDLLEKPERVSGNFKMLISFPKSVGNANSAGGQKSKDVLQSPVF